MKLYRRLAIGSVLLQVGPVLWWWGYISGSHLDAFTLVALPGLWTFLFSAATVIAIVWEQARSVGARIIMTGQITGMLLQILLTALFISKLVPTHLEYSGIAMIGGQSIVLLGLLWHLSARISSEKEPS